MSDQIPFIRPKNVEDARKRQQALSDECQGMHVIFAQRKATRMNHRGDDTDYRAWKAGEVAKIERNHKEMRLLRMWIHENKSREDHSNDAYAGMLFIKNGMKGICRYIEALNAYAKQLRDRLEKYEKGVPDAPGFGTDWWREQD